MQLIAGKGAAYVNLTSKMRKVLNTLSNRNDVSIDKVSRSVWQDVKVYTKDTCERRQYV